MSEVWLLFLFGERAPEDQPVFPSGLLRQGYGEKRGEAGGIQCRRLNRPLLGLPRGCLWFRLEITAPSLYWVLEGFSLVTLSWDLLQEAS